MAFAELLRGRRIRPLLANLTLMVGVTASAALVAEGLVRAFHHDTLGWAHRPETAGTFSSFGIDIDVRINSSGFRGPDYHLEDHQPRKRVVVLGDSFVWGYGVEEEEMFTSRLDTLLPDVQVFNLGVSGYSTDQELLLYARDGKKYSPHLVVLVVANNDFALNLSPMAYMIYGKPVFEIDEGKLRLTNVPVPRAHWLKRGLVILGRHSYVLAQLHRAAYSIGIDRLLSTGQPAERAAVPMQEQDSLPFPQTADQKLTMRLIEEVRSMASDDSAQFVVLFVDRVDSAADARAYLGERGIRSILVDDWLGGLTAPIHLPDGLHWTPEFHEVVARALANEVRGYLQ